MGDFSFIILLVFGPFLEYHLHEELDMLKSMGIGILLITHDISVAKKTGDYIAVMQSGKIVEYGGTQNVLHAPTHEYTKKLIRASVLDFGDNDD